MWESGKEVGHGKILIRPATSRVLRGGNVNRKCRGGREGRVITRQTSTEAPGQEKVV